MLPEETVAFTSSRTSRTWVWLVRRWADVSSFIVGAALVCCIFCEEIWLRAGSYGEFSDYWEHAAVLHALIVNPWHPANPQLSSPDSSPRFGPVAVLNALVARAFGLDALNGLRIAAVAYTVLFVAGSWLFFRVYFRDSCAGLYGLLVMLGSWWEAWTFSSIYQPKVLLSVACYPWLAALGLTLLGLALAVHLLRAGSRTDTRWWFGLGVLVLWAATVFLTHQLTAMMALSALFLLALSEPTTPLSRRAWVAGSAIAGCILSAFWPYFSVWGLMAGGHQDAGWVGRGVQAAVSGSLVVTRHRFYHLPELLSALGLGVVGVLSLPYFFLKRRRLFVGLGVLSMFGPFAVNAFVPLPLGHRFLLLGIFFVQVAVVWLLMVLTPGSAEFPRALDRRWLRRASLGVVWGTLLVFGYHNVARTRKEWRYFAGYARRGESPIIRYARRAAEIAGDRAVILGDTLTTWPIPAFGPKIVALRHENPFIFDEAQRDQAVDAFLGRQTSDDERLEIIRRYQVTHVIVAREPRGPLGSFLASHAGRDRLPGRYLLFTLRAPTR
jgi:hypothetical protein